MRPESWYLLAGALLLVMALATTLLKRLPLTAAIVYLAVGYALGPGGAGWVDVSFRSHGALLEHLTEAAVLVSLFASGLKLRLPLADPRWWLPVRLAGPSMLVTIALVTAAAVWLLGLPLGAGLLLGAILAPTDPVLASDVQVENPEDRDRLRFALTGEAGLNDGTAFPFVMLGLGLLGLHGLGAGGLRWVGVDLIWATAGGLAIGWLMGSLVGRLVIHLRREHKESVGLDDFLALGLIAGAYGVAIHAHAYGFLAVFAAGVALRRVERKATDEREAPAEASGEAKGEARGEDVAEPGGDVAADERATHPQTAPAHMAESVLGFNEQLERIAEVAVVVVVGLLLSGTRLTWAAAGFAALVLLVIRPASAYAGLIGARVTPLQRRLTAWFGIRGVGSIYYLAYAATHGLPDALTTTLAVVTITTVAASTVVHGVSVTPLMTLYAKRVHTRRDPVAA